MKADNPAPIACMLSPKNFQRRAQWLKELASRALISHRQDGLSVHLNYKFDAAEDVEQLVHKEQRCCNFLRFDLSRGSESIKLIITAPADATEDARALYAHILPNDTCSAR